MSHFKRRDFLRASAGAALLASGLGHPLSALAAALERARILCGFPVGGGTDAVARMLADKMAGSYARTLFVDNPSGAGGRLAIDQLLRGATDGSDILITPSSTVAMYPHIYSNLAYKPQQDLAPVSLVCEFVHGLAVGPAVPASVQTLADFIAWCKANPGKASCANPGEGTLPHFLTMMLSRAAGVALQPVPYRGTGPALTDVLGGQVPAIIVVAENAYLTHQKQGGLRILATSGPQRSPFFKDVPTFSEQGFAELTITEWFGLFMRAGTPAEIVERAASAARDVLARPDAIEALGRFGMVSTSSTPAELAAKMRDDDAYWARAIKATGFTPLS